jgi:cellulose synthase/poly-beta-1,6-N-acetylglucosamine synthase-like glycosyltransferase
VSTVDWIVWIVSIAIFLFFVLYSVSTFALIGLSLVETSFLKVDRGAGFTPPHRRRRPGISLVVPTYNVEPVVVASVQSFLACDYEPFEVVIVDDGSTDETGETLARAFDLVELPVGDRFQIPTAEITNIYVSRSDPRLRVVRKENGGRSDAINAGLNVAYKELVAFTDADSFLEPDALKRVGEVFADDPDDMVGVGGTIRIANGAVIEHGVVTQARISARGTEATQAAEYLRGFLGSRIAWSRLNGLLIISGAFGVFHTELIRSLGGLSEETLGEDMELVMRLHHQLHPGRPRTRIGYAPDANVWTEVPPGLKSLRGQRVRWHVGLLDNLRLHRKMILRRRFGAVGLLALPYAILFEVIGPLLQLAGYAILVALVLLDAVSWWYVAAFFIVALLVGQLQTAGAILIEEVGFGRYRTRDLMVLAGWGVLELFWYRPLTALWRTWATVLTLVGRRPGWGSIPRGVAIREEPEVGEELVAAPLPR